MRPQWEIDAIDAADDAREVRRTLARISDRFHRLGFAASNVGHAIGGFMRAMLHSYAWPVRVKKGRGQRRNRRNR